MLISVLLSLALRFLIRRSTILSPSKGIIFVLSTTFVPEFLVSDLKCSPLQAAGLRARKVYRYLVKIGTPRRDPAGNLVSSGEDLNQGGITEWCFDVLYVTCGWWCFVYQLSFEVERDSVLYRALSSRKCHLRRTLLVLVSLSE